MMMSDNGYEYSPTRRNHLRPGGGDEDCSSNSAVYASRRKFLASAGKDNLHPPKEFQTKRQARREFLQHIDNDLDLLEDHPAAYPYIESNLMKKPLKKRRDSTFILKSIFSSRSESAFVGNDGVASGGNTGRSDKGMKLRKAAQFVMHKMNMDDMFNSAAAVTDQSMNHEDWKEEFRAGVHLWVNKNTGEVNTVCPWLGTRDIFALTRKGTKKSFIFTSPTITARHYTPPRETKSYEEGTGALVYDSKELDELFALLDKAK